MNTPKLDELIEKIEVNIKWILLGKALDGLFSIEKEMLEALKEIREILKEKPP